MSFAKKNFRVLFAMFGLALAIPTALTIAASAAQASGYMVASGINGEVVCSLGGNDDCPDDSNI
jgi:hypothetical protein